MDAGYSVSGLAGTRDGFVLPVLWTAFLRFTTGMVILCLALGLERKGEEKVNSGRASEVFLVVLLNLCIHYLIQSPSSKADISRLSSPYPHPHPHPHSEDQPPPTR